MVETQQRQQQSYRPKLGLLVTAITLGILSYITLFSVEFTALRLKKILPEDTDKVKHQENYYPAKIQQQQLPLLSVAERDGWEIKSHTSNTNDDDDDDNVDQNNSTTTVNNDRYANMDLQLQISKGSISNAFTPHEINQAILQRNQLQQQQPSSPACYPHFNLYQPNGTWDNTTKFKRILFYHARKAGGSSMYKYLIKVAETYGIKIEWIEWTAMEEPGTHIDKPDEETFYVTHLREPIDRSISHFKYNGRWPCKTMIKNDFVPTEENANKLEMWNETGGHEPKTSCHNRNQKFRLGDCAVNCYTQWFGGLNCVRWQVPIEEQYKVAMSKLLKYNLVVVIEKLRDPDYVHAIESFFGVTGILKRGTPFCERISHKANTETPLIIRNETRARLTELNRVDLKLYHAITDCLDDNADDGGRRYEHIPKWDGDRFMINSYNFTQANIEERKAKARKAARKAAQKNARRNG
jgi:hypothetical protein